MKMIVFLAMLGVVAGVTTGAVASDREVRIEATGAPAIATESIKTRIDQLGYDVVRLERDDGAFDALIVDRASGGIVKAHFDLATGELLRASPAH